MNEIALSNDLTVIEQEIYSFHELGSRSVWEIGKRLNHVKENDLTHGEFGGWLKKIGMNHNTANRYMKINKELNYDSSHNLGFQNLYHIALLPEEERDATHTLPTGETKKVDEMTVRELQEVKRQLKQKDQEIERLKNAPPKVIEKEVVKEKVPHDYNGMKSENQQLSQALTKSQREAREIKERLQHLMNERKEMDEQSKQYEELSKAIQEMEGKMTRGQKRIEAQRDVYDLVSRSKTLLMEITPIPYVIDSEYVRENEYAKRELLNISEQMQKFLDNLHDVLEETNFIEGEIING